MAATQMTETLKEFVVKVTTSKVSERRRILQALIPCVSSSDFPENALKGVLKHLSLTIGRYHDGRSRHAVEDVLAALVTHHCALLTKHLVSALSNLAELQKTLPNSTSSSGEALSALSWTCLVVRLAHKSTDEVPQDTFDKLVAIQSLLVYGAYRAQRTNISHGAYKKLKRIWREVPGSVERYAEAIGKQEPSQHKMCMISCIMQYLSAAKDYDNIKKFKPRFIEDYVKAVLQSRTKPPVHVLESGKQLVRHVTHEEFKGTVLVAVQKSMLRNPEIMLQGVSYLLAGVTLDLSSYIMDLGKPLATQLHSQDEETRAVAAEGCGNLARQCSDPGALEKLVKHLFAVLNGTEGKLTLTGQRMGVLAGVGKLSDNTVTGTQAVQNLSEAVTEFFIPVLQTEVHEGTLVHALSVFSLWLAKFTTNVPSKIIEWFKTGIGLKSSTSNVRSAYIQCMNAAFHGDTLIQGLGVLQLLLQVVDKASSQPTQVQLVSEALAASCLLVKLSLADIQAESKLGPFWNTILDMDKQLFVNEKFLTAASEQALQNLSTLVERLTLDHPQKFTEKLTRPFYYALVYALVNGSFKLRQHVGSNVRKMLSALGGSKMSLSLVREFQHILATHKSVDAVSMEIGDPGGEVSKQVPPRILAESLVTLCKVHKPDAREAEAIAMETLVTAHHPAIMLHNQDTWTDLVASLKIDAGAFVNAHAEQIVAQVKNQKELSVGLKNAISTTVRIAPKAILPKLVDHICSTLDDPAIPTVTREEYTIMNWANGELFNKSVLNAGGQTEEKVANVRRENKLYSYEEQMAEIELRKEIERKKKGKGGGKEEPKLTKKQQEALEAELQREREIRCQTRELDRRVEDMCSLVEAATRGNRVAMRAFLPQLLPHIIPLVRTALGGPRMCPCYAQLRQAAFEDSEDILGLIVAYATLRQLKPEATLDPAWTEEPLKKQVERAVKLIHEMTVPPRDGSQPKEPFLASTFSYCFYLLRCVLQKEGEESLMLQVLEILMVHAKLRSQPGQEETDEAGPHLLPRCQMLELLVYVIGTSSSSKVHQMASAVLLEVARSASGMECCATAEQDEIDVLLGALHAPAAAVREAALQGLDAMVIVLPTPDSDYENGQQLARRIWVARYDIEEDNRTLADKIWQEAGLQLSAELCAGLSSDVTSEEKVVRQAAAEALSVALKKHRDHIPVVLEELLEVYEEKLYMPPPVLDSFGRVISEAPPDKYQARCGVALALCKMSPRFNKEQIEPLFGFFVQKALGDRNEEVRKHMLDAAVSAINEHGKDNVNTLLPVFEAFLVEAPDTAVYDAVRQSVVILMGSLAKHLDKEDTKVKPIVAKLIETLSTPSQQVQEAVANCLPPLVPAIKQDAPDLVHRLLQLLLESENYGERKGAAYGLAGLVKGLGILALKQLDIMATLQDAIQNKKNPRHREGALFAFEMLCTMLGRLFEPYVVHILPHLLLCFGDGNQYVREAADDTAKAVMSKLSAHGVKLVLPSLLSALEEDSWRTKTGSVELLGAMAFCAPKQLSACLPSIVPKLTEVLTDSHIKVQKAGAQALKQIGSVIRNPEIQAIVPDLLDALQDPTMKTTTSLQTLLETKFVHFIDAPSLALIMPVVQRAFQDRSTETRKMAAQIIGNMYSLTDQKDLAPYLPTVIPGLKQSLLDPVPEVRSVSSRALGAIMKGMGESGFEDLLPWLMQTLTSENSSVDRSGAAQGLSEVVGSLGQEKLAKLMPDIIQTAERSNIAPHVRDGYIMMYIYLPGVFGEDFIQYVGPIIPSILKALADESEFVRDTALRAGQRIVNLYADTAITLLLPELERGLFDDNWRIRYSSVQLLGDLLYRISGVSGKMSTEGAGEDDNFGTESSAKAILKILGEERRNRVLAGLYMGRSDTALMVRQAALHVWKVVVTHTPKMLREILSTLFTLLLGCLASTSYDKRQVAARTLGDIVRKLGEKVLPEIIPILEHGLDSDQSDQRQGVCIGLSEIMQSTSRDHVVVFADSLIPTVRRALCDPLPEVREAAAQTFDNLHANIGPRALDEILPDLLGKLGSEDQSEYALDGLKQVMAVKSRVVLPYLVPQLTAPPVNTRALAFLSSVAGEALTKHLSKILPALISALSNSLQSPQEQQEKEYCQTVVLSVVDDMGLRTVMDELLAVTNDPSKGLRCAAVTILDSFCSQTKADYSEFVPQLLRGLIRLFTDTDTGVLEASWQCLNAVTKKLDASEMLQHISNVRQAVRFAAMDLKGQELPGFCLPKKWNLLRVATPSAKKKGPHTAGDLLPQGITPILPIFREGILNGPPEMKESAAIGLGEVIKRTSAEALKPSVVHITGPLIRILGDRFSFSVKVAVLETLGLLLGKCGAMLKPFLPQLQTTFIKALNDSNRNVRLKAAAALGKLIVIHTRVDPLFTELHTGVKNADDPAVRDTMLQALRGCISGAGAKMSDSIRKQVTATLEGLLSAKEDSSRLTAAGCLGALCGCLPEDELALVLNLHLLDNDLSLDWTVRHGHCTALMVALKEAPQRLMADEWKSRVLKVTIGNTSADRIPLCLAGLRCVGYLMACQITAAEQVSTEIPAALVKSMKHESNDIKALAARVVSFVSKHVEEPLDMALVKSLVPMLVNGTKEKNTLVRTNSELALVSLLQMRTGDDLLQACLNQLDSGMKDSLNDVASKVLRKVVTQPDTVEEQLDDTILT